MPLMYYLTYVTHAVVVHGPRAACAREQARVFALVVWLVFGSSALMLARGLSGRFLP